MWSDDYDWWLVNLGLLVVLCLGSLYLLYVAIVLFDLFWGKEEKDEIL